MLKLSGVCLRQWTAIFIAAVFCAACGDPGTGGSGVPTASNGTGNNQTAPVSDTSAPPSQASGGLTSSPVSATQLSTSGVIETTSAASAAAPAPASIEIQVAGIRFDLRTATLVGIDGLVLSPDRLLTGVPVILIYPASADLAAAAVGATGAAVPVVRATVIDPLPGLLISEPAPHRVLLDNGNTVIVAAQAARVGNANAGNRVRAWIFGEGASALVTRLEFE